MSARIELSELESFLYASADILRGYVDASDYKTFVFPLLSPMEACIVICKTNKPANRRNRVLFINAKNEVTRKNAQSYLETEHIDKIAQTYHDLPTPGKQSSCAFLGVCRR